MKFNLVLSLLLVFTAAGCSKTPEKFFSPVVRVDVLLEDNREVFLLRFTAGLKNENSSIAFTDVKGMISFYDDKAKQELAAIPFEMKTILPFDTGIIETEKKFSEKDIMKIVDLFGLSREDLLKNKTATSMFVDEKNARISSLSFGKESIVKLLQEKI